ncbi:MAG: DEAD/DEAH box helicase [Rhodanobacteraceae bacterium]|nr:DEAD/DEAH box helicase [Rhodanobacteraceae bacterium]
MTERTLTDLDFDSFGLHPSLSQGLHQAGFTRLTPIQALTLPETLQHHDVAGQAQTGTGKTAAFLVTLMQRLLTTEAKPDRRIQDPRSVILAPTRELAIQIHKDAMQLGGLTGLRIGLVYGGVDYEKQRAQFAEGCDVLIGTPGRLMDYLKQHVFSLRSVEVVVLDEADRMFDLGFIKDIRYLLRKMPPPGERQGLLFSATLSHRVLELAYEHMNEPKTLKVETDSVTTARVSQRVYFPASDEKLPLLIGLLSRMDAPRTIIFVNTKAAAEQVHLRLEKHGWPSAILSGDVPQQKRQSLLGRFQRSEVAILVATDVAARGLHIPDVSHVFNYDLPQDCEDYVHRIGRTARFGASGDAISFACERYAISLPDIETYIGQRIPVEPITNDLLADVAPLRISRSRDGGGKGRGGPGRGGPGGGRRDGGRSGGGSSGSGGRRGGGGGGRGPRPPRSEGSADAAATPAAAPPPAASGEG